MKIKIDYLDDIKKEIEMQTNTLIKLRKKYDIVVDEEEAVTLIEALDSLKNEILSANK